MTRLVTKRKANIEDARRVWEAMASPSGRRVATRLTQAGLQASYRTVCRWHKAGWTIPSSRLLSASERLEDASSLLTGDPTSRSANIGASGDTESDPVLVARRRGANDLTDADLLHQLARQVCINILVLSQALQKRAEELMVTSPVGVGERQFAMSTSLQWAILSLEASRRIRREEEREKLGGAVRSAKRKADGPAD